MEYPLSEIIDRWSILVLKSIRLPEDARIYREKWRFMEAAFATSASPEQVRAWFDAQVEINDQIWELEAAIRRGVALSLEEVGRRALLIRDLNRERIRRKNEIARVMGEFEEVKIEHASEEGEGTWVI